MKAAFYLLVIIGIAYPCCSYGASYWQTQGHTATTSKTYDGFYMVFVVDWDPSSACKPSVGLIMTKDSSLGTYVSSKRSVTDMRVRVGGEVWSDTTMLVTYTNGVESMMYAPMSLIDKMKRSITSYVEVLFNKLPNAEFSLEGASSAIELARTACR